MKITPDHLARGAFIYVRQSTVDQLANNHESRRRQYGLADRARALGWTDVTVIDDDLGRSGSGVSRPCLPSRRRAWRATDATGTR
jgi:DNA invertase Pin-like site-specific DNA recombinase